MTKLGNLTHWVWIATCLTLTSAACGDDDDDIGTGNAGTSGRGGASLGGSGNAGGFGNDTSDAGDVGVPGTGGTHGGTGGTTATPNGGGEGGTEAGAGASGGEAGAGEAIAALSDAQILLVLDTLNQGEVEEAYAVLPRLTEADVETFAQMMITDHGSARQAVATTADDLNLTPAPSAPQRALMRESQAHVTELRATPVDDIDRTYVALEVTAHAEALALLGTLDASADAAALRTLIGTLTATVQDHYDAAQTLSDELESGSGGNGGSGGSP